MSFNQFKVVNLEINEEDYIVFPINSTDSNDQRSIQFVLNYELYMIVSTEKDGYIPKFALDPENNPIKGIKDVLIIFKDKRVNAINQWFMSPCGYLNYRLPKDVILSDYLLVVEAAIDEAQGITHG